MYDHSEKREIKKEDVDWVDMDFDTCVKEQRRECYYGQDSDAIKDQRTQMGQFCGHDEVRLKAISGHDHTNAKLCLLCAFKTFKYHF